MIRAETIRLNSLARLDGGPRGGFLIELPRSLSLESTRIVIRTYGNRFAVYGWAGAWTTEDWDGAQVEVRSFRHLHNTRLEPIGAKA